MVEVEFKDRQSDSKIHGSLLVCIVKEKKLFRTVVTDHEADFIQNHHDKCREHCMRERD